ncbi:MULTISPECIES: sulfurtransferase TusA [unclassified Endozoicomonas]|uniref:sulfurtransferase TusA n=1 Tax=unclassified Endozoicomonas TaxID=2644528 RepID=UPI0021496ED3|nr:MULTISPECIES: sulfurtransferase TusA [unclassified Endozoicomonas]
MELDTSGLLCPEPVMKLHNKVRDMKPGEMVRVIATDPSSQRDIPRYCKFPDHELLSYEQVEKQYVYLICKAVS